MYIKLTAIQNGEPINLARNLSARPGPASTELEIALCELTYYHWWYNICTAKKNNQVFNGRTKIVVPDGYYNVCELNEEVFQPLGAELRLHEPYGLLQLTTRDYEISMNRGMANILGFSKNNFEAGKKTTGNGTVRKSKTYISNEPHKLAVDREVYFHIAEISTSDNLLNGRPSTLIRSVPVENEKCGSCRTESFPVLQYKRLSPGPVSQLTVSLRDTNGER